MSQKTAPKDKTMDLDFTAIQVAEALHGLTFAEAELVFDKTRVLLGVSHRVNTRGPDFQDQIAAFTAYYGDDTPTKNKLGGH